jgi:hypothetical protein
VLPAAGLTIAEFSTIGRVFATYTEVGFASLVIAKHAIAIGTTWGVPLILATAHDNNLVGVLRVQLCSLLPHSLSLLAGAVLASLHQPPPHSAPPSALPSARPSPMPGSRALAAAKLSTVATPHHLPQAARASFLVQSVSQSRSPPVALT